MKRSLFSRGGSGGVRAVRIPRLAIPVAGALVAGLALVPVTSSTAQANVRADCWRTTTQYVNTMSQVALGSAWDGSGQVSALDVKAFGSGRSDYVKATLVPLLFGREYAARNRTDAQIVRDVIEAVAHRAPVQADYDENLWKLSDWYGTGTVAQKVNHMVDAIWWSEARPNVNKLCTTAEAGPTLAGYTPGPDVDAKKCWQTTTQFVSGLAETSLARRWSEASVHVAALDAKPFGAERAAYVKTTLVPLLFGQDYTARGRSDTQMVRDMVEGLLHRWPSSADYAAMKWGQPTAVKVAAMLASFETELDGKLRRLCATAETNPAPATYVIPSDVDAKGKPFNKLDTNDVQWRTEVRALGNTDATVSDLSFGGTEPVAEAAFTVTGITAAGKATVADIKVGTRLAAQTTGTDSPSVLIHVESVTGTGDARTVSGRILQLPDLIRSGELDLTSRINDAVPAAIEKAMQDTTRARSEDEDGTAYDENGNPISLADATPGFSPVTVVKPKTFISRAPNGDFCLNATNASAKATFLTSDKNSVSQKEIKRRNEQAKKNGVDRVEDRKTDGSASIKLDEAQACIGLQASGWKVTPKRITGTVTRTTSSKFHVTAAFKLTGTASIQGTWEILEKELSLPITLPGPIVIPTTLAGAVNIPYSASLTGTVTADYAAGTQITNQKTITKLDTNNATPVTQENTAGTRDNYGKQVRTAEAELNGKIKVTIAPSGSWNFGDFTAAAGPQVKALLDKLPKWGTAAFSGLVKVSASAVTPEVAADIKFNAFPSCILTLTPTVTADLTIGVALAEAFFKAIGRTAPAYSKKFDLYKQGGEPIHMWQKKTGVCSRGDYMQAWCLEWIPAPVAKQAYYRTAPHIARQRPEGDCEWS